jgi:multiple sugar transport system permease protein
MVDKLSQVEKHAPAYVEDRPSHWEDPSKFVLIMPAILVVLFLSVFPLLLSLFTSVLRITFVKGGFDYQFVGLDNYRKLLMNPFSQERARGEHRHFMGKMVEFSEISTLGWIVMAVALILFLYWLVRFLAGTDRRARQVMLRLVPALVAGIGLIALIEYAEVSALFGVASGAIGIAAIYAGCARLLTDSERRIAAFGARAAAGIGIVVALRLLSNALHDADPSAAVLDFLNQRVILDMAWLIVLAGMYIWVANYLTGGSRRKAVGVLLRSLTILIAATLLWITIRVSSADGLPGTLVVTLIFVFGGVTAQYVLGLGLALLVTQNLPGRRFFRVVFLLPMMITPVGIGFLFRMLMDTIIGPLAPLWSAVGLADFSWVEDPSVARAAIIFGDTWQWTPFVFIILLAGLEGLPPETVEAALVDGANRIQMFRYIILPQIVPVSTTVILIRMIEAFKIIDMPQILTRGGPGTATESMTLHSYNLWRALDLGPSSALAYILLFIVTFLALVFVNFVRQHLLEAV